MGGARNGLPGTAHVRCSGLHLAVGMGRREKSGEEALEMILYADYLIVSMILYTTRHSTETQWEVEPYSFYEWPI